MRVCPTHGCPWPIVAGSDGVRRIKYVPEGILVAYINGEHKSYCKICRAELVSKPIEQVLANE